MIFRKTVLVAATVAACSSSAMAADKTPSLGDVLKASGVTVNGYIDFSYIDRSTDKNSTTYRNYDTEQRGFTLQMTDLTVGYLPASGFGGQVELNYGSDAKADSGAADPTKTAPSYTDVQQAYLQYATGPFSVMAGKFDTIAGAEVIQAPSNTNFSRSFLFTYAEPALHTGVRGVYALSDTTKFTVGVNNGWNVNQKSVKPAVGNPAQAPTGNTLELGASVTPVKILSLSAAYYQGQESGLVASGTRSLLDLVATVNATDALSFALNYDGVKQDNALANGTSDAKWDGIAGYANYKFSDQWRVSFRTEKFKDKDGYITTLATGGAFTTSQTLKENTLTVGYAPVSSFELRGEYRADKSDHNTFNTNPGDPTGSPTDKQHTLALEGVYKF